jgi:hypothetical protein
VVDTGGGGGAIDLGTSRTSSSVTITNTGGDNANIPAATSSLAGVMTATDKQKLDAVPSNIPEILEGSSFGQTLRWDSNNDRWQPNSSVVINVSNYVSIRSGAANSTWQTAIGSALRVSGNVLCDSDIQADNLITTGSVTANVDIGADNDLYSGNLSGTGTRNVNCTSTGRLVAGDPVLLVAQIEALLAEMVVQGVITAPQETALLGAL